MVQLTDHPIALLVSAVLCLPLLFPLGRFFFGDFESFKEEFGLSRRWERELWLLGFIPSGPMIYVKVIGFLGVYAIVAFALHYALANIWQWLWG